MPESKLKESRAKDLIRFTYPRPTEGTMSLIGPGFSSLKQAPVELKENNPHQPISFTYPRSNEEPVISSSVLVAVSQNARVLDRPWVPKSTAGNSSAAHKKPMKKSDLDTKNIMNIPKLPANAETCLKSWYIDHQHNPYPSDEEKVQLATLGGISKEQVSNWFRNQRTRDKQLKKIRDNAKSEAANSLMTLNRL